MTSKYYSKHSIYCVSFCPYRHECDNEVCPIRRIKAERDHIADASKKVEE